MIVVISRVPHPSPLLAWVGVPLLGPPSSSSLLASVGRTLNHQSEITNHQSLPYFSQLYLCNSLILLRILLLPASSPRVLWRQGPAQADPGYIDNFVNMAIPTSLAYSRFFGT